MSDTEPKHSLRKPGNLTRWNERVHLRVDGGGNILPVDAEYNVGGKTPGYKDFLGEHKGAERGQMCIRDSDKPVFGVDDGSVFKDERIGAVRQLPEMCIRDRIVPCG